LLLSFLARRNAAFPADRRRIEIDEDEVPPGRKKKTMLLLGIELLGVDVDFGGEDWPELTGAGLRSCYPGRKEEVASC
jgi:hypothetical protein